jgi:WD40 repeat protein
MIPVSTCLTLALLFIGTTGHAQTASRCTPSPPMPNNPKPGVVGLTLSRDGKTLLTAGGDGIIRVWDLPSGQIQRTLTGHTNVIYIAEFSPDEKLIASSSRDTTARIWDFATGRELHKFTGFHCAVKFVTFSPNGKTVAAVGNDGMLKVWDVKTGRELKSLVHSNSPDVDTGIYSVVFSRDGKKIYAGNGDGTISEWNAATGEETDVWKAHSDAVMALAFSPDYRLLASTGNYEATMRLWDAATKHELQSFAEKKEEGVTENSHVLAISPNQKMVATSVAAFRPQESTYVYVRTYVWDIETGKKLFTLEGQKFDVGGLVFTPYNRYLLAGSVDQTIKIYDLQTGKEARTLRAPWTAAPATH